MKRRDFLTKCAIGAGAAVVGVPVVGATPKSDEMRKAIREVLKYEQSIRELEHGLPFDPHVWNDGWSFGKYQGQNVLFVQYALMGGKEKEGVKEAGKYFDSQPRFALIDGDSDERINVQICKKVSI